MSAAELRDILRKARIPTSSHRHLISDDAVQRILSRGRILHLLQQELCVEFYRVEQYTDLVCARATKVLSILICIGRVAALINHFLQREIFDHRLPLTSSDLPEEFGPAFLDEQLHFLAPIFASDLFKELKSEVILPFSLDEPVDEAVGSFASIYKIQFVPGYQKLAEEPKDEGRRVAILYCAKIVDRADTV